MASDAPACDVDGAHVPLRAGALQPAPQEALRGEQLSKHAKCGWMFIELYLTCGGSSEMGPCDLRAADPFWAACREGGSSISELKGVFSLFTSEMSSETATLKALRSISELNSQELFLR